MRAGIRTALAALLIALSVAPAAARRIVLRDRTPVRAGIGKATALLETLDRGVVLEVATQEGGWLQITLPDGRSGWVFHTHVREQPDDPTAEPATDPPPAPPNTAARMDAPPEPARRPEPEPPPRGDDVRALQTEVAVLRTRIEQLEGTVDTLRSPAASPGASPAAAASDGDGLASTAVAALVVGLAVGWIVTRLARRRAERRQWNRVRL